MAGLTQTRVILEGREILVPSPMGNPDIFTYPMFYFNKPTWEADEHRTHCISCESQFTQIRRKHHCRNCGRIFCDNCCNAKVALPQLALEELQRVCKHCCEVANLVCKSRSDYVSTRKESVRELVRLLKEKTNLLQVVEAGGIHTIVSLTSQGDREIKHTVAQGVHILAQNLCLQDLLVTCGVVKAIFNILTTGGTNELAKIDCLGTLSLLCTSLDAVMSVLVDCDLGVIEELMLESGTLGLLASSLLYRFIENLQTHSYILKHSCSLISNLWKTLSTDDVEMSIMALRILTRLSAGSEKIRLKINQEDNVSAERLLLKYFVHDKGYELKSLRCCLALLANLATVPTNERNSLQSYLSPLLELLDRPSVRAEENLLQLSRAISNYAEFPVNTLLLIGKLPSILRTMYDSANEVVRNYANQIVIKLLIHDSVATLEILNEFGSHTFLENLFSVPGLNHLILNSIGTKAETCFRNMHRWTIWNFQNTHFFE